MAGAEHLFEGLTEAAATGPPPGQQQQPQQPQRRMHSTGSPSMLDEEDAEMDGAWLGRGSQKGAGRRGVPSRVQRHSYQS